MKPLILAAVIAATFATPAHALRHYLVAQWSENGNNFCRYANGTVLNVRYRICPLSIED